MKLILSPYNLVFVQLPHYFITTSLSSFEYWEKCDCVYFLLFHKWEFWLNFCSLAKHPLSIMSRRELILVSL